MCLGRRSSIAKMQHHCARERRRNVVDLFATLPGLPLLSLCLEPGEMNAEHTPSTGRRCGQRGSGKTSALPASFKVQSGPQVWSVQPESGQRGPRILRLNTRVLPDEIQNRTGRGRTQGWAVSVLPE